MAKQKTQAAVKLEPVFGDVEVEDGQELSYRSAKIDVLGTQATLTISETPEDEGGNPIGSPRPRRIDRITQARMIRDGDDKLIFVGISDRLRHEVGTTDAEVRWIVTPRYCADCGG